MAPTDAPASLVRAHPEPQDQVRERLPLSKIASSLTLCIVGLIFALPLLWILAASFDSQATFSIEWPHWTLRNFEAAYQLDHFHSFVNSFLLSGIATVSSTVLAFLAGYALSRTQLPFKRSMLIAMLFLTGIPVTILIIPVYELFAELGWLSIVPTAIFLGATSLPFQVYIIKNAVDAVPRELEDAAVMERASTYRILQDVILPLALPGVGAAAIFGFVSAWGNFLIPYVLLPNASQQPAQIEIYSAVSSVGIQYGLTAAYALVYALPVILLYALLARLFRGGSITTGALQGI
jgi:multiple sugar transport system permease protein